MTLRRGIIVLLVFVAAALGSVAVSRSQQTSAPAQPANWEITGDLEESCSCNMACPCWFGSKPTRMNCSGGAAVVITQGHYGSVPLDGLTIAQFAQSPDGKSMMESLGSWNFGYLYIDEKANDEQRDALQKLSAELFPPVPADHMKIRYVPIVRTIEGNEHKITFGDYGSFSGHLVEGGMNGTCTIKNAPMADPIHASYQQGVTTGLKYDDAQKWDFANTNYMYTNFHVTSADYQAFESQMAEKMKNH